MTISLKLGTLGVHLKLDDAQFKRASKGVKSEISSMRSAFGVLGKTAAAGGAAVGAGLGVAIKASADLEAAVMKAASVTKQGSKNFDLFKKAAVEAGLKSAFSAKEAGDALTYLSQAGFQANDSVAALPGVLSLASAATTDLATTADIASNIMSGFGISADEFTQVADKLTATFTASNTNLEQLGTAMSYAAPAAKATGQSLSEMAAAVGRMSDAGIQGSKAGTALRMAIVKLQRPTRMTQKALADLGLKATDLQGNFLDALGTLDQAGASFGHISAIFGSEAAPGIQKLMDDGVASIRAFADEIENSGGRARDVEQEMLSTLSGQVKILEGSFNTAAATLGDSLAPALKDLVPEITKQINAWASDKEAIADVVTQVSEAITLFQPLAEVMGFGAATAIELARAFKVLGLFVSGTAKRLEAARQRMMGNTEAAAALEKEVLEMGRVAVKEANRWGSSYDTIGDALDKMAKMADKAKDKLDGVAGSLRKAAAEEKKFHWADPNAPKWKGGRGGYANKRGGRYSNKEALAARKRHNAKSSRGSAEKGGGFELSKRKKTKSKTAEEILKEEMDAADKRIEERRRANEAVLKEIEKESVERQKQAKEYRETFEKMAKENEKAIKEEHQKLIKEAKQSARAAVWALKEKGESYFLSMAEEIARQDPKELDDLGRARQDIYIKELKRTYAAIEEGLSFAADAAEESNDQLMGAFDMMASKMQSQLDGMGFEKLSRVMGGAAQGAQMGMAMGGPAGAAAGAIGGGLGEVKAMIKETIVGHQEFKNTLAVYNNALSGLQLPDVLGNFLKSFQSIGILIKQTIGPFEALGVSFEQLGDVSKPLFGAARTMALGINRFSAIVVDVGIFLTKIGHKLARLVSDDLAKTIFEANSKLNVIRQEIDAAAEDIYETSYLDGQKYAEESLLDMADAAKEVSREMLNVPTAFKAALRIFEANDAGTGRGGVASRMASGTSARRQAAERLAASGARQQSGTTVPTTSYPYYNDGV